MECEITLTANAGVIIAIAGKEILIDALHDEKTPRFSTLSEDMVSTVWRRFTTHEPSAVMATHLHQDHFSRSLWDQARQRWPESTFVSPSMDLDGTVILEESTQSIDLENMHIDAMLLPHEGAEYKSVVNYGYFIEIEGFTILVLGDCALDATDQILALANGRSIDLALLNFPWVTLTRPRAFVQDVLSPKHLGLIHLPFSQDDRGGYRPATLKASEKLSNIHVHILSEPLQKIEIF